MADHRARTERLTVLHDTVNIVCIGAINAGNFVNIRTDSRAWEGLSIWDGADQWARRWQGEFQDVVIWLLYLLATQWPGPGVEECVDCNPLSCCAPS
jgi:hypothetical protein